MRVIDETWRYKVTWLDSTPQQVDIDLKNCDYRFFNHLKVANLEGVEGLGKILATGE